MLNILLLQQICVICQ